MKHATDSSLTPSVAAPALSEGAALHTFETSPGLLARLWRWVRSFQVGATDQRRLKVADTVSLGEKRFVAVVQVDGRHFLLAGGPANIALLAQLNDQDDFGDVLQKTMTVAPPAPVEETVVEQKAPRKRAPRPKKKVMQGPIAPPKRARTVATSQKVTSAATKKQPALAAKRNSKPVAPQARFGDIPAAEGGVRAFERWLGRTIPSAETQAPTRVARTRQPVVENPELPGPLPTPAKAALSERLTEMRPVPEKQTVQVVPEPVAQSTIEEYA